MSAATDPRRITGPWDEAIVKAHRVASTLPVWQNPPDTWEEKRQARRNAMYVPGEPATMCIGSDSYAMLVVAVDRFKTGAKKGQVKAVHAVHRTHDGIRPEMVWDYSGDQPIYTLAVETYTRRESRRGPCWRHSGARTAWLDDNEADCFTCWDNRQPRFIEKGSDYCSLVVGYAEDYRDPHF